MSSTSHTTGAAELFYSYAHEDESLRNKLDEHLSALVHSGQITEWHDREIGAGAEWEGEIKTHLESAQIILLLISSDFIASEYCHGVEMKRAMERHAAGEALVIPIILRPVFFTGLQFSKLQALPRDAKPVTQWVSQDEAFASIASGISEAIEKFLPKLRSRSRSITNKVNRPRIGELLPYLCDRSEQEDELEQALLQQKAKFGRRPFLCVVHSDEYECHDMFRRRLSEISLPRLISRPDSPIAAKYFEWPPASVTSLSDARDRFRRTLAEIVVDGNRDAENAEILESLSQYTVPILFYSHLNFEILDITRPELRDAFIKFWNDFPDLPAGQMIIACLFVTYKRTEDMGWLNKLKYSRLNTRIKTFLTNIDFATYGNLHGVVLSELRGIHELDVANWIRKGKDFRGFCQEHDPEFCKVERSVDAIHALYQRPDYLPFAGQIPMQFLADDLTKLLEEYRC